MEVAGPDMELRSARAEVLIQKQDATAPSAPSCSAFTPELTKFGNFGAKGGGGGKRGGTEKKTTTRDF